MEHPEMPTPIGVFRQVFRPPYDASVNQQLGAAMAKDPSPDYDRLIRGGNTWIVQ
jgi:hypothetical protein